MTKLNAKYFNVPALLYREHGVPEKVLNLGEVELKETLGPKEISVSMLISPINPSDINQIQGKYGILPSLPAVAGNEGVGRVTRVGSEIDHLAIGDHVIPIHASQGTWRKQLVSSGDYWMKIPTDISIVQASMLAINPCTAYRMLKDFVNLQPGDVVLQNGANSAVGQAVIQIARAMNLRTINIVRDRPGLIELKHELTNLGATLVCTEEELLSDSKLEAQIADLGLQRIKLAFNCVGGKSLSNLVRLLAPGSTAVTYGGMSRDPSLVSTSSLIFQDISYRGFWITKWKETHPREDHEKMMDYIFSIIRVGGLMTPKVDLRPITEFQQTISDAQKPYRDHKLAFSFERT